MVSFTRTQGLSSDSSSSTSTSLSSMLSEMEKLLKTPYVGGVYFPTLLAVSHLQKEEESETAISSGPPSSTRASQRRRKLVGEDNEQEKAEEGLTMPHLPRTHG